MSAPFALRRFRTLSRPILPNVRRTEARMLQAIRAHVLAHIRSAFLGRLLPNWSAFAMLATILALFPVARHVACGDRDLKALIHPDSLSRQ